MSGDAYVFADLRWPMPDPGLVAVWRAMSLDASRWDDWDGFAVATPGGTIAEFVDQVRAAGDPLELEVGETGVRLRACFAESSAGYWQKLAVAWRLAADIGASGEFAWVPIATPGVAYRAVIADFSSRWEKLPGAGATALDAEPGKKEIDALVEKQGPRPASKPAAAAKGTKKAAARPAAKKPAAAKPAAKSAKKSGSKKR